MGLLFVRKELKKKNRNKNKKQKVGMSIAFQGRGIIKANKVRESVDEF